MTQKIILTTFLFMLTASAAGACSCMRPLGLATGYEFSSVVFIGQVKNISKSTTYNPEFKHRNGRPLPYREIWRCPGLFSWIIQNE